MISILLNIPTRAATIEVRSISCSSTHFSYSRKPGIAPRDWRTSGIPAPPSLIPDESRKKTKPIEEEILRDDDSPKLMPSNRLKPTNLKRPTPQEWAAHRSTMHDAFPEGWSPPHKISRQAMDGLRSLHRLNPETFSTPVLAERFKISPEAVRRILRSRWEPSREKSVKRAREESEVLQNWKAKRREGEIADYNQWNRESGRPVLGVDWGDKLTLR